MYVYVCVFVLFMGVVRDVCSRLLVLMVSRCLFASGGVDGVARAV